jgi:hypothetical protein
MVSSPKGLGPEKDCAGKGQQQTRPLVREDAPQEQDRNSHTSNKDLVVSPKWVLYSKTDWQADRQS